MTKTAASPEIMCTLTSKQIMEQEWLVKDMYNAGMRAVRINTAHLSGVDELGLLTERLKSLWPDVRILIDTKGPEMRTTAVASDAAIALAPGDIIDVVGDTHDQETTEQTIRVNYKLIHKALKAGDRILIDDGHIALRVEGIDGETIHTRVEMGGMLGSRKGLAVEDVDVDLPAVSAHDNMYIRHASTSENVDVIAHSFVRSSADVVAVRNAMISKTKPIIAKIENQQGLDNLKGILQEADGVLIARGDLTASIGAEAIPEAQARISQEAKKNGRPLYLATNILRSMMDAPEPTEHDIMGIRIALAQGMDVMLLTNETAAGAYPAACVKVLYNEINQP